MRIHSTARAMSVMVAGCLVLAACGANSSGKGGHSSGGTVAFLLPENTVTRYEQLDRPFFQKAMQKYAPGAQVRFYNALGDPATQVAQAETALTQGANVLVVAPTDTTAAAAIVNEAHQDHVPVISYSRLVQKAPVDYFIGKDSVQVGHEQGTWLAEHTKDGDTIAILDGSPDDNNAHQFNQGYMQVLQPLFDSKKRTLAGEIWVDKYDPSKAQSAMEQLLTRNHNNIQGVLAANDGVAGGAVAALRGVGLAGKVNAITGLDATLAGAQRILQGTQGMSILQSIPDFSDATAQIAAILLQGKTPPASMFALTTDNGVAKVPTVAIKIDPITKDNVMDTVNSGLYTKADLCKGVAPGIGPC